MNHLCWGDVGQQRNQVSGTKNILKLVLSTLAGLCMLLNSSKALLILTARILLVLRSSQLIHWHCCAFISVFLVSQLPVNDHCLQQCASGPYASSHSLLIPVYLNPFMRSHQKIRRVLLGQTKSLSSPANTSFCLSQIYHQSILLGDS